MRADGQTDAIAAFRNFAKAQEKKKKQCTVQVAPACTEIYTLHVEHQNLERWRHVQATDDGN